MASLSSSQSWQTILQGAMRTSCHLKVHKDIRRSSSLGGQSSTVLSFLAKLWDLHPWRLSRLGKTKKQLTGSGIGDSPSFSRSLDQRAPVVPLNQDSCDSNTHSSLALCQWWQAQWTVTNSPLLVFLGLEHVLKRVLYMLNACMDIEEHKGVESSSNICDNFATPWGKDYCTFLLYEKHVKSVSSSQGRSIMHLFRGTSNEADWWPNFVSLATKIMSYSQNRIEN